MFWVPLLIVILKKCYFSISWLLYGHAVVSYMLSLDQQFANKLTVSTNNFFVDFWDFLHR